MSQPPNTSRSETLENTILLGLAGFLLACLGGLFLATDAGYIAFPGEETCTNLACHAWQGR